MKKRIVIVFVLCLICVFNLFGCRTEVEYRETSSSSMFVVVEVTGSWKVVYHKETKVMYAVSNCRYNYGNFTLMVDENGKPLLWQGE